MEKLIDYLFQPPKVDIDYPLFVRIIPGFVEAVQVALKLTYQRGILDGFILGVLLSLLLLPSKR